MTRSLGFAVEAFRRIGEQDVISWTVVISACSDNAEPAIGLRYFIELLSEDVELNEFMFTTILRHSMSIKLGFQGHLQTLEATIMKRLSEMEAIVLKSEQR